MLLRCFTDLYICHKPIQDTQLHGSRHEHQTPDVS